MGTLAFFLGQNRRVLSRETAWSGIAAVLGTAGEKDSGQRQVTAAIQARGGGGLGQPPMAQC